MSGPILFYSHKNCENEGKFTINYTFSTQYLKSGSRVHLYFFVLCAIRTHKFKIFSSSLSFSLEYFLLVLYSLLLRLFRVVWCFLNKLPDNFGYRADKTIKYVHVTLLLPTVLSGAETKYKMKYHKKKINYVTLNCTC